MLGLGIVKGMAVTIKHFFMPKVTVQYPEQRRVSAPAYRGAPALVFDAKTNKARCVACGVCARACPHGVIHVTGHTGPDGKRHVERYEIEIIRCLFCGLCAEACPYGAVKMSHEFELAEYRRYNLVYDRERLQGRAEPPSKIVAREVKVISARALAVKEVAQIR
ncbi:MAG: NADH-quinone oxidoreductase subunit I [Chloroflexi bacterium]|nr:NADH-quinone oxidoreductase subunit I [Chloroflexota bacterium]